MRMGSSTNYHTVNKMTRSKGVALITAILITSLVSIAAVAMITRQQLDIRRTQNIIHYDQVYAYLLGAEEWARNSIIQDSSPDKDYYPIMPSGPSLAAPNSPQARPPRRAAG